VVLEGRGRESNWESLPKILTLLLRNLNVEFRLDSVCGNTWISRLVIRIPTEAEWEYAARAGTTGIYSFGNDVAQLKEYAWYSENSQGMTHSVRQLKPNAWGYDMHGNVGEWVQDWYAEDYYKQQPNPDHDLQGPEKGGARSVRGGSWGDRPQYARASRRGRDAPDARLNDVGFRCAQ